MQMSVMWAIGHKKMKSPSKIGEPLPDAELLAKDVLHILPHLAVLVDSCILTVQCIQLSSFNDGHRHCHHGFFHRPHHRSSSSPIIIDHRRHRSHSALVSPNVSNCFAPNLCLVTPLLNMEIILLSCYDLGISKLKMYGHLSPEHLT